jgi:hypothetical protein
VGRLHPRAEAHGRPKVRAVCMGCTGCVYGLCARVMFTLFCFWFVVGLSSMLLHVHRVHPLPLPQVLQDFGLYELHRAAVR